MDDQLPLPLTIKTRSGFLRDKQLPSSHQSARPADQPKPVFPFPTLAGSPGETRQNNQLRRQ